MSDEPMRYHDAIRKHGLTEAKAMMGEEHHAHLDSANRFLQKKRDDRAERIGYAYSALAYVGLPHRKNEAELAEGDEYVHEVAGFRLSMTTNRIRYADPKTGQTISERFGLPYGADGRRVLLYLQTQAVLTQSREIELGGSFTDALRNMGIPNTGYAQKHVQEQINRIKGCHVQITYMNEFERGFSQCSLIEEALEEKPASNPGREGKFFVRTLTLSQPFYNALCKHALPIDHSAINNLDGDSRAMDIYVWLAYRLHVLKQPTPVSWSALYQQFGKSIALLKHFKPKFREALGEALAVYDGATVEVTDDGVILHPSNAPVSAKRAFA